ncbi:HD domain-containing protein [Rossellomorea marisflavi]|uniref:HD domain-containing protein n=1 Tax=Rossellomorea marisflavi TaxID=189381 RepID=UPI003FA04125
MAGSRVLFFEHTLSIKGFDKALEALDWMKEEMCKEKGFSRHDGGDYYDHLVATAQDLLDVGIKDEDIIIACLLHDSVEDVEGITVKMVAGRFGENVAHMVDLVTKKPGVDYKVGDNLKRYLEAISKHPGASLIKTADRIHNFGTLKNATPEKKLRQALETEKYFIPFFKTCRGAHPRYAKYFFRAKTTIEPHLWEIKEHYEEIEQLRDQLRKQERTA